LLFQLSSNKLARTPPARQHIVQSGEFMSRSLYKIFMVAFAFCCLIGLPSCGHDQKLVGITVRPGTVVFEGVGATVQFTAVGTYIHPPETKDITNQVIWKINIGYLATIDNAGLAVATGVCGAGQANATVYSDPTNPSHGSVVIGSANISGIDQGTSRCQ
jgi:hypothetical protein